MKNIKIISILSAAAIIFTGCGTASTEDTSSDLLSSPAISGTDSAADSNSDTIDIDLTKMDSSMVYAQVYDMVYNGDNYFGKKVKVKGPFSYFKEDDRREFFAVLVSDATACCSQGIEFVLKGESEYPDDYPKIGTDITVVGEFNYYKEDYNTYIQLTDAAMEVDNSLSWQ